MKRIERLFLNLSFRIAAVLFSFAVVETVANVYLMHLADDEVFARYASFRQAQKRTLASKPRYTLHRYLGYYPTPGYSDGTNRHNALGYRGDELDMPKPDGRFRIVCVGGSTTYTSYVDDYRQTYPYLLENCLKAKGFDNVDVVNAGAGGWSSWESLINFEFRVLDLDPDLIIVYQSVNDIHPRLVWPPEAYQGDNSGRREPNESAMFMPSILEYSTVLRVALIKTGMLTPHAAFARTIDWYPPTYVGDDFLTQKKLGEYPSGVFKETSAEAMLARNTPKYFERNIRSIIAIAKSNGVAVVVSSFANSPEFTDDPRSCSPEYLGAYDEHNRLLEAMAKDTGVHFFDFAAEFPTDKKWYVDSRHVNEDGAQLKAELYSAFLTENNLVPTSTRQLQARY